MKSTVIPAPLEFGWTMKPLESAQTQQRILRDGRLELAIVHGIVKGVTPEMLFWWFSHIGGDMNYRGQTLNRYRVWHPLDHVHWSLHRKGETGDASLGAQFHIVEALNRRPDYLLDAIATVERLDDTGIRVSSRRGGLEVSNLEHTFTARPEGTLYRSRLLIGTDFPLFGKPVSALLRRRLFSQPMINAWLRHNVEEVGNFEFFLRDLFEENAR